MATSPLAKLPLDDWRLRWAASPLPAEIARFREGLLDLLPPRLRHLWFPPIHRLWLRIEQGRLQATEEAGTAHTDLGSLPLADGEAVRALMAALDRRGVAGEVWLRLPAAQALVRRLSLPSAAEAQLDGVMRHEIDRQTPFTPDQVVFAAQVLARRPGDGQLTAELAVVPKATLDAALAALGPLAERLSGADIDDGATSPRRNVLPVALRAPRSDRDGRVRLGLMAVAAVALVLTGWVTLSNRERALQTLEAQRDAAFDTARESRALRQQLDSSASAANFLAERRQARPTVLELLNDLTQRLPDDVYLQRLSIEQDRVTLTGAARSAGTIVATLQGSPYLKGPALAGAVQQDRSTGRDNFTVIAELVPGGRNAPQP